MLQFNKLEAKNLKKNYKSIKIIKNVSLQVKSGEVVGLLGPNGAGKTTCFYMLLGLISPDEGNIFLNESKITEDPIHVRSKKGLSYLPQEASIFRKLSVSDNIEAVLQLQKNESGLNFSKKEVVAKRDSLMEEMQIMRIRNSFGYTLSGGERRRVEIARAMASSPKFLLLDEPFAGVDPIAVIEIQRVIRFLKSKRVGVLITDHNVRETLGICDKATIINDGLVLSDGNPSEIIKNSEVKKSYLGEHFRL
ncbi:MAG: LPS export ABC transporter ATP-binding protein [Betaproteobacteria bacterium TMED82]|nr:MAG: LPS export ABC transporter ATP-binding protein [Betaproteobacteria bacterium TMED82]|tara:strand:+ start:55305 stop:56054 length:750 start_codon:yes stop_codon:yes gene_type:complete